MARRTWRGAAGSVRPGLPDEGCFDVATGTGSSLGLRERSACDVVGLDRSAECCGAAAVRNGHIPLVAARAESLPFSDESSITDLHLPPALRRRSRRDDGELARVVRPGGRIAARLVECPQSDASNDVAAVNISRPAAHRPCDLAAVGERRRLLARENRASTRAHSHHAVERYWRCRPASSTSGLRG